jgi:large subunit ribosomal protein L4
MRRAALNSALTQWLQEGRLTVVDDITLDEYKTRRIVEMLGALGLAGQKVLIVIDDANPTVEASARNVPGVGLVRADGVNVYDVLRHDKLLITKAAVEAVERRLAGGGKETSE